MTILQSIILAIVEGLTEFLPVSSTGHMIIAEGIMGMEGSPYLKAYTVIIQLGAMLSVVVLYWKKFFKFDPLPGKVGAKKFLSRFNFYGKLIVGLLPAVFFGLLLEKQIDMLLESVTTVAVMLLLGGIFMLFIDKMFENKVYKEEPGSKSAFVIGLFQCIAMIPGVSRSMATIVGGMQQKLTRKAAAEFSFFLAVPTMCGATLKKVWDLYKDAGGWDIITDNLSTLIIGNVVAFLVALLAIKGFIGFLTKHGFKLFGYYRIVIGALILVLLFFGVELQIH